MTEQELRWSIRKCREAIESLNEDLKKKQKDHKELEDLIAALGSFRTRLEGARDSGIQSVARRAASILAAIKSAVFDDFRTVISGPAYSKAQQGVSGAVGAAKKKLSDVEEEIQEIKRKIKEKERQLGNYQYQLNNLPKEG